MDNPFASLLVVPVDELLYRVVCRRTGQTAGYLARGRVVERREQLGSTREEYAVPQLHHPQGWYVLGHDWEWFHHPDEALAALRDEWLCRRKALELGARHREVDGKLRVVAGSKAVRRAHPDHARAVRREDRELRDDERRNRRKGGLWL